MNFEKCSITYCIEIEKATLLRIDRSDNAFNELSDVDGVIHVNYDPMFGPFIWIRTDDVNDLTNWKQEVTNIIEKYTKEVTV